MKGIIGQVLGRVFGGLVGAASGALAAKGVGVISLPAQDEITTILVNAFMLIGYGVAHKLFDHGGKPSR